MVNTSLRQQLRLRADRLEDYGGCCCEKDAVEDEEGGEEGERVGAGD